MNSVLSERKLRTQFTKWVVFGLIVPVALALMVLMHETLMRENESRMQVLSKIAAQIATDFESMDYVRDKASDQAALYNRYRRFVMEEAITVYVLDAGGEMISSNDENTLLRGAVDNALLSALSDEKDNSKGRKLDLKDDVYLTGFAQCEKSGWQIAVAVPMRGEAHSLLSLFFWMLAILGVVTGLFGIAIFVFTKRVSVPLQQMIASMRQVEQGDFVGTPDTPSKNEIGEVVRYYNHMVQHLKQLIEDRYEKERQSKALEAKVLMGQINPHFIYNTLETIVWKANLAKRPDISQIAAKLGLLLRQTVRNDTVLIPLKNEIEQALIYVDIQKTRYQDKLQVNILPYDADLADCCILRLILQPGIENAIVHGMPIDGRPLTVNVFIYREGENIKILIEDDGIGVSPERLDIVMAYVQDRAGDSALETVGSGVGIRNIQQRLVLYFGKEYGIEIESVPGERTVLTIRMPYQKMPQ
jgi:Predicted signal transduction protein with a C-terminal ATPase domain